MLVSYIKLAMVFVLSTRRTRDVTGCSGRLTGAEKHLPVKGEECPEVDNMTEMENKAFRYTL